jgi:ParB family chromosome partitioning protein
MVNNVTDPKSRLGMGLKGLGAFFENSGAVPTTRTGRSIPGGVEYLPMNFVRPNPNQPRKNFDESALADLARSIEKDGLLQPILVRKTGANIFEIVAGERRFRAAEMAGLKEIPSIIKELDEKQAFEIALIENIQRENLNPVEEALGYQKLISEHGYTQQSAAELVHKSRSYVANMVRILSLPKDVLDMISDGKLPYTVARTLIGSDDPAGMAEGFLKNNVNAREAERKTSVKKKAGGDGSYDPYIQDAQGDLALRLGMPVEIKDKSGRGHVLIIYQNRNELKEIIKLLNN